MILHRLYRRFSAAANSSLVLMYHRVADEAWDPDGVCVSPAVFEQQLQLLTHSFRVLPLSSLIESWQRGKMVPHSIALTFDDGYLDNFTQALPLLEQYGVPATFFLTNPGPLFWWDELKIKLSALDEKELESLARQWRIEKDSKEGELKTALYQALAEQLKASGPKAISELLQQLPSKGDWGPLPSLMGDKELCRLAARPGMDIGAHTASHPFLPRLAPGSIREELVRNKRFLEERINRPVTLLAYPFGGYDNTTVKEAKTAGFKAACTTKHHSFRYAASPFGIGRYRMGHEAAPSFLLALSKQKA